MPTRLFIFYGLINFTVRKKFNTAFFVSNCYKKKSTFRDITLDIACKTFFPGDKLQKTRNFRLIFRHFLFHLNATCFHFQFTINERDRVILREKKIAIRAVDIHKWKVDVYLPRIKDQLIFERYIGRIILSFTVWKV